MTKTALSGSILNSTETLAYFRWSYGSSCSPPDYLDASKKLHIFTVMVFHRPLFPWHIFSPAHPNASSSAAGICFPVTSSTAECRGWFTRFDLRGRTRSEDGGRSGELLNCFWREEVEFVVLRSGHTLTVLHDVIVGKPTVTQWWAEKSSSLSLSYSL